MKRFFCFLSVLALLQTSAFANDPTKPTPAPDIGVILNTLNCSGTILDGVSARLKPGAPSKNQDEFNIEVVTTHETFPKNFVVVGSYTSRDQYVVHGSNPEAFILFIDKLGVHGAHNASLEFPFSNGVRFSFECYFY